MTPPLRPVWRGRTILLGLALATCAPWLHAADPADPQARVSPLAHRSLLQRRPPPPATEPADWRAANERVRAVGGWKAYLREAQQPDAPTQEVRP